MVVGGCLLWVVGSWLLDVGCWLLVDCSLVGGGGGGGGFVLVFFCLLAARPALCLLFVSWFFLAVLAPKQKKVFW